MKYKLTLEADDGGGKIVSTFESEEYRTDQEDFACDLCCAFVRCASSLDFTPSWKELLSAEFQYGRSADHWLFKALCALSDLPVWYRDFDSGIKIVVDPEKINFSKLEKENGNKQEYVEECKENLSLYTSLGVLEFKDG